MGQKIFGGFLVFIGAAGLIVGTAGATEDRPIAAAIIGLIFLTIGIWVILRNTKRSKERREKRKSHSKEYLERYKRTLPNLHHMDGLPLAQGTPCAANIEDGILEVKGGGTTFRLGLNKITDATVKTETEIQKAYVSSIGGAVAGAVVFGALGAMIGGRAKEKESKVEKFFLIITYLKEDGDIAYISFQADDVFDANKFANCLMNQLSHSNTKTVEL